jgi:hypothetical protein
MLIANKLGEINVNRRRLMISDIERKLSKNLTMMIISVLFAILFFASASGQSRDQVTGDLEETDRIIERADEVVKETGSEIGFSYLEHARELQGRAWEAHRGEAYGMARKLTFAARENAMKAIGAVQVSDYNAATVGRQIERTDDVLKRAQDKVGLTGSQKAVSLLENAIKTQIEAREFFRGNRLRIALKATLKARESAVRAVEIAGSDRYNAYFVERELHRTDELIAKAADMAEELGSNGVIRGLLGNAREMQSQAYVSYRSDDMRAAMNKTSRAREITRKALKRMEKDFQPERVERFLHHNDRLISEVSEVFSELPNAEAERLLEIAIEHQKAASAAFSRGDLQAAIVEAKAARELVSKAQSL